MIVTVEGSSVVVTENGKKVVHKFDTAELAELSCDLLGWTEENNLPWISADDLLHQLDEHDERRTWLLVFILRWEEAEDRA